MRPVAPWASIMSGTFDEHGIWANRYQKGLEVGVMTVEVVVRSGLATTIACHSLWQSVDSSVVAGLAAQV